MNNLPSYLPYLYKWEHKSGKWYIGCKTSKGCHPKDHETYICSSEIAKPLILENRSDWTYKILAVGEKMYIRELESLYLRALDAKNDPNSYNRSNIDGAWKKDRTGIKDNLETRKKKSISKQGKNNPMYGKTGILSPHYGKTYSDERRANISKSLKGKVKSKEHSENISKALKGNPLLSERMKGKNNPMYGVPASEYNKRMTTLKNSGANNPMRKPEHQRTCPHCQKTVAKNHYTMFHGPKCKSLLS